jgi:hypothetical protein
MNVLRVTNIAPEIEEQRRIEHMTIHRKIGGIHWFAIGPFRISFCRVKRQRPSLDAIRAGIDCIAPELPKVSDYPWPN